MWTTSYRFSLWYDVLHGLLEDRGRSKVTGFRDLVASTCPDVLLYSQGRGSIPPVCVCVHELVSQASPLVPQHWSLAVSAFGTGKSPRADTGCDPCWAMGTVYVWERDYARACMYVHTFVCIHICLMWIYTVVESTLIWQRELLPSIARSPCHFKHTELLLSLSPTKRTHNNNIDIDIMSKINNGLYRQSQLVMYNHLRLSRSGHISLHFPTRWLWAPPTLLSCITRYFTLLVHGTV